MRERQYVYLYGRKTSSFMRKLLRLLPIVLLAAAFAACQPAGPQRAKIETNFGDIVVELYDETPAHRDNFIKLVDSAQYYDGTLFHRVIPGFMIQGGDPQSIGADDNARLGGGGPGYTLPAEIGAPHLRGTLAAARTQNPQKRSSGSQFYIVTGTVQSAATMDRYQQQKGIRYNEEQLRRYTTEGGTPQLDMDYTVFGEVVSGMEVVDQISQVTTKNKGIEDRPLENVVIESIRLID